MIDSVYISPNEVAMIVKYKRNEYGVMVLTSDLKQKWATKIDGAPVRIGKFHNKLLVIASTRARGNGIDLDNSYDGYVLDPLSGNIITHSNIFPKEERFQITQYFVFNKLNNDFKMIVRTTETGSDVPTIFSFRSFEKKQKRTKECKIISFNEDLSESSRLDFPVLADNYILNLVVNNEGEMFAEYFDGTNVFTVQKIDAKGQKLIASKSFSINDAQNKTDMESSLFASENNSLMGYLTFKYKNQNKEDQICVYKIAISSNDAPEIATTILENDFFKTGESVKMPLGKHDGKADVKNWDGLLVNNIFEYKNYILVYKEVRSIATSSDGNFNNGVTGVGDGVLNIYDENLKEIIQQVFPKRIMGNGEEGVSTAFQIHANILSMLSANLNISGLYSAKGEAVYAEYDLDAKKLIKYELLNPPNIEKERRYSADPRGSIWLPDGFILNIVVPQGMTDANYDTYPEKFSY